MTINHVKDICQVMDEWAPQSLAYDWDNVGLQIGTLDHPVKKVLVTLDVLETVADEAIDKDIDLIISHHPLLFKPLKQLDTATPKGRTIQKLLHHDIAVFSAHTNLDLTDGGMNDMLCDVLGITDTKPLSVEHVDPYVKICVYVPATHAKEMRSAFHQSGAGHIGKYSHCTFQTIGTGTFMPLAGTNPYIGEKEKIAFVDEVRMETIVTKSRVNQVVSAIKEAHPYEEVAYDIYPLANGGKEYGIGRIGVLAERMTVNHLCEHVKKVFDLPCVRVTGDLTKEIKSVAVLGGSGEKYVDIAQKMGADVYITGDMTFHIAQEAEEMGLTVIDPGHHIEKVMKEKTKQLLETHFDSSNLTILTSKVNTEPFRFC